MSMINTAEASQNTYDHKKIESEILQQWEEKGLFQNTSNKATTKENKEYLLFAFAYPSGEGLHVGHVESKTALDILARYYRMQGKDVFFPVGWDAFGLPAENYAVKTKIHPSVTTKNAIKVFSRQIKQLGISYDWSSEIATCDPEYYKWTQWLFLELYKNKKAYKKLANVNWCPSCNTVLANEQVVEGSCERCGTQVIQKDLEQWFFKITDYKDELISGLDQVDWPSYTKQKQLNWIGRSEGAEITFKIVDTNNDFKVYTTAHDTIYGVTFMVLAPEHPLIRDFIENAPKNFNKESVSDYVEKTKTKTEEDRIINREKSGVFTGLYALNPLNGEKIPVWVADYVLMNYGTGAIMAVPGHDERDADFAKNHNLNVIYLTKENTFISYSGKIKSDLKAFHLQNSAEFNDMSFEESRTKILSKLESLGLGYSKVQYRLRDWLISRQRYWGAPIPIVYDPEGNPHPVKQEHLPWVLPTDVDFLPTGESPSRLSKEFGERVERLYGKGWTPDYDTLDTFVDSSWYYLRFPDARNDSAFASKDKLKNWLPVDFYMIGPEHTVLHLLYSRFFTKCLRDMGYLNIDEPFQKMRHQGMILGPDNKKMSKSKGNVINPDLVVEAQGADTLRVYEMFMGPIDADKPWSESGVAGARRFLSRINSIVLNSSKAQAEKSSQNSLVELNALITKVGSDIPVLKFNTAIAAMMTFLNVWEKDSECLCVQDTKSFLKLLCPFAPFLSDYLWQKFSGEIESIHLSSWPQARADLLQKESFDLVVQVSGKVRGTAKNLKFTLSEDEILSIAKDLVSKHLEGQTIKNKIYIKNRLVNFVI